LFGRGWDLIEQEYWLLATLESLAYDELCKALPFLALRALFANEASYLLGHDKAPQSLAINVLNLLLKTEAQVRQTMVRHLQIFISKLY
jgi:hypothetical protein